MEWLHWAGLVSECQGEFGGGDGVRVRFRLRTGSGGLMEDLKRCRRKSDARCVLCDEEVVEDVRPAFPGGVWGI